MIRESLPLPDPDDISIPDHLYMARKTFEFGTETLTRPDVRERTQVLLSRCLGSADAEVRELDSYWAMEQALYELLAVARGMPYERYLPGRSYTYQQFAGTVTGLAAPSSGSVIDVGCGSAILSRYIYPASPDAYLALDVSAAALQFAMRLAADVGRKVTPVAGSGFEIPLKDKSVDVGVSLGLLEHFSHDSQVRIVSETRRACRDIIVFAVPNTSTAIFSTMATLERQEAGPALQFPLEEHYSPVDFRRIASDSGASLISEGSFHVVPPRRIPTDMVSARERTVLTRLIQNAANEYQGSSIDAWTAAEAALPETDRSRWGWFSYGAFSCRL